MSAAASFTFEGQLQPNGLGFMPMAIIIVPEDVVEALGGNSVKRVVGTLNGHPIRRGLLPMSTGQRFLLVSKALRRELRLSADTPVTVTLAPDPNPNQVDLPEELADGLEEWPEAAAAFVRLTPGRQRNLVHYIDAAKRPETRAQRVVKLLHQLANGAVPFRPPKDAS
ncbi:YdeI/OmpD-associated family protein [Hymenobacter sp. 15J16-1T3B]|uniref:YdeI/OmpD-associated family protein n=1 Tax=Hymenobacter sp. 15J16-1T3B TaxID=2886941 RepID=UPI001D12C1E0|nr:YdeI/OmpD-associated family protein [Hymenobacter sp. 15J16-1T3B]MCC3156745.1 YdeI/OmpD-associated family protein [Hymenobacter sp. 15J16-1T3B]